MKNKFFTQEVCVRTPKLRYAQKSVREWRKKMKNEWVKKKRGRGCIYLIAALLLQMVGPQLSARAAADVTVHIMQGELGQAINRTMRSGEERSGWEIELNQGRTVKRAVWKSSDASVMTVDGNNSGATVKTHKEGTAVLSLTVVTDQDETVEDECLISSVTTLDTSRQAAGYIKGSEAEFYRGARTTSKVRNTASGGQRLTVIALCDNFYRVRLPESYDFNDTLNQDTAYVLKTKVEIPAASVSITNADSIRELKVGDKIKAVPSILPDLTTAKDLVWESSDEGVAAIDGDGSITAKKAGSTIITLTEKNSGKKSSVTVTVSDVFATSLTISNKEEIAYLPVGSSVTAKAEILPANTSKKKLVWRCDDTRVASVDQNGVIRGLMGGTATVKVTETYSGLSTSCKVRLLYHIAADKGTWKNIRLKKSSDFRGNHISWDKVSGAKYYRIYIGKWNKKKGKYTYKSKKIKKNSYYDTNVTKGKKYKYYIKVYGKKGKKLYQSNTVKIKATAPELTLTVKSPTALILDWRAEKSGSKKGIRGYRIYRSTKKTGKYTCVKRIAKKSAYTWTDTKRKQNKRYYYKVCAYRKEKKKLKNGSYSNIVSGRTCSVAQNRNKTYFAGMKGKWQGVCIEQGEVSESQSRTKMNTYSVIQGGVERHPHIKYHLTPETLYIHIYLEYCTYVKNKQGGYDRKEYKAVRGVYRNDKKHTGKSYQEEFETGIMDAYSVFVVGNKNDFGEGINFRTKPVIHDRKDKETYAPDQQFLQVRIGGECPDYGAEECESNQWFHAYTNDYNVLWAGADIYMPENDKLKHKGEKRPLETVIGYRECAAHELGHVLGLADAYYDEEKKMDRLLENGETCFHLKNIWTNIMESTRKKVQMKSNDIEMMLLAYGLSFKSDELAKQYYREYVLGGYTYPLSPVIKTTTDMERGY